MSSVDLQSAAGAPRPPRKLHLKPAAGGDHGGLSPISSPAAADRGDTIEEDRPAAEAEPGRGSPSILPASILVSMENPCKRNTS
jgi:hypothetical protein